MDFLKSMDLFGGGFPVKLNKPSSKLQHKPGSLFGGIFSIFMMIVGIFLFVRGIVDVNEKNGVIFTKRDIFLNTKVLENT